MAAVVPSSLAPQLSGRSDKTRQISVAEMWVPRKSGVLFLLRLILSGLAMLSALLKDIFSVLMISEQSSDG